VSPEIVSVRPAPIERIRSPSNDASTTAEEAPPPTIVMSARMSRSPVAASSARPEREMLSTYVPAVTGTTIRAPLHWFASITAARSVQTPLAVAVSHTPSPGAESTTSAVLLTVNMGWMIAASARELARSVATTAEVAARIVRPARVHPRTSS
jgi:hypothetical protein